jgi:hypothetical protein
VRVAPAWLVLLLAVAMPVSACQNPAPEMTHPVAAVVTESGAEIARFATGLTQPAYLSNCGPADRGRPIQFDGRFVGWTAEGGMHVVDLHGHHGPRQFSDGLLVEDGLLVQAPLAPSFEARAIELATDSTRSFAPPAGWMFLRPTSTVAVAQPMDGGAFRLFDLEAEAWLTQEIATTGPSWPQGKVAPVFASRAWVILQAESWWAYDVRQASLRELDLGVVRVHPYALRGDTLLIEEPQGGLGGPSSALWGHWLETGERGPAASLSRLTIGDRTAQFVPDVSQKGSPKPAEASTTDGRTVASPSAGIALLLALGLLARRSAAQA